VRADFHHGGTETRRLTGGIPAHEFTAVQSKILNFSFKGGNPAPRVLRGVSESPRLGDESVRRN
jgi:hypothetical protein